MWQAVTLDTHCPGIHEGSVDVAGPGCWTENSGFRLATTEASSPGKCFGGSRSEAAAFCVSHGSSETKPEKLRTAMSNGQQVREERQCQPLSYCSGKLEKHSINFHSLWALSQVLEPVVIHQFAIFFSKIKIWIPNDGVCEFKTGYNVYKKCK